MSKVTKVKVKLLSDKVSVPELATSGAAGFDLRAAETWTVYPQRTVLIGTGLAFEIPEGYELQVRPRSGMSLKTELYISNSPGTVDSDYRGEVKIIMRNHSTHRSYKINAGDRIAQAVIAVVPKVRLEEVEELGETERADGGFGSTGEK